MSADYFGLAVGLMCSSAAETVFDRELRPIVEREVMIKPLQNAVMVHQCFVDQFEAVIRQRDELLAAATQTLEENGHLADGDNCTLKVLKDAVAKSSAEDEIERARRMA